FPELSRSLPQMTDDLFPEPLDAFEALGAVRVVASRIGTRVSGANAQVVGPQPLSDLREPLEPKVPRAEDQEALFERRDRIAADDRSRSPPPTGGHAACGPPRDRLRSNPRTRRRKSSSSSRASRLPPASARLAGTPRRDRAETTRPIRPSRERAEPLGRRKPRSRSAAAVSGTASGSTP